MHRSTGETVKEILGPIGQMGAKRGSGEFRAAGFFYLCTNEVIYVPSRGIGRDLSVLWSLAPKSLKIEGLQVRSQCFVDIHMTYLKEFY